MVNFICKSNKQSLAQSPVRNNMHVYLQVPVTTTTILDGLKDGGCPSEDSLEDSLKRPTAGLNSRRGSTMSTYSEQAEEEAHMSQEERVRLAIARLRGPQYEEFSSRIYGPWY